MECFPVSDFAPLNKRKNNTSKYKIALDEIIARADWLRPSWEGAFQDQQAFSLRSSFVIFRLLFKTSFDRSLKITKPLSFSRKRLVVLEVGSGFDKNT